MKDRHGNGARFELAGRLRNMRLRLPGIFNFRSSQSSIPKPSSFLRHRDLNFALQTISSYRDIIIIAKLLANSKPISSKFCSISSQLFVSFMPTESEVAAEHPQWESSKAWSSPAHIGITIVLVLHIAVNLWFWL